MKVISIILPVLLFICGASAFGDEAPQTSPAENTASTETAASNTQPTMKKQLNPWVDCGIGAMIFTDTQWAAVSSNIIWDLGTTAVISNASSQETCESARSKTAMFVGATYANLEEETIKGNGQHLQAMLDLMGCKSESHSDIIKQVRMDFSQQLQNPEYAAMNTLTRAESYYNMVKATVETSYAEQCQLI